MPTRLPSPRSYRDFEAPTYNAQERIYQGCIETGYVDHPRRIRNFIGSRYRLGRARDHQWVAGRPMSLGRHSGTGR